MNAGQVLKAIPGLTREKLDYYVRQDYLHPQKIKHGSIKQKDFSEKDLHLLSIAWRYISNGMFPRLAFEKAEKENKQSQLDF